MHYKFIVASLLFIFLFVASVQTAGAVAGLGGGDPFHESERNSIGKLIQIDPSKVTGAYQHTYELTLPPGRNGLTPELALQYSSQPRGNISPFGYGWSINIPYIERIPRKGTDNLYTEDFYFSTLDGELKASSTSSGTEKYGALVDRGNFNQYNYIDNEWWEVTDKNGTVYRFGSSTATRLQSSDGTKVFRWMLEEVRDRNDNYISYSYFRNATQLYPNNIKYTGNGSTDGVFEVSFTRENRDDVATSSIAGFPIKSIQRTANIFVKVEGGSVRKYELDYGSGDNGNRSLLTSITESGFDGAWLALPATTFSYSTQDRTASTTWNTDNQYSVPAWFTISNADQGVRVVDINGDSLPDVIESFTNGVATNENIYINDGDGTGWTVDSNYVAPPVFINTNNGGDQGIRIADVDGDGLPDLIQGFGASGTTTQNVYINDGDGTGWTKDTGYGVPPIFINTNNGGDQGIRVADVNGDGLADFIEGFGKDGNTEQRVYINDGDGTGWTIDSGYSPPPIFVIDGVDQGFRITDVNGDGLPDFVEGFGNGVVTNQNVYINDGDGTGWTLATGYSAPPVFINTNNGGDQGIRIADVNGDRLPDFVEGFGENGSSNQNVLINNGDGTGWTTDANYDPPLFIIDDVDQGIRIADVNGDGIEDMVRSFGDNPTTVQWVRIGDAIKSDLLTNVTESTGGKIAIEYTTTASTTEPSSSTLSNPSLPFNFTVIETVGRNDGVLPPLTGSSC